MRLITSVLFTMLISTAAMAHDNYDGIRNRNGVSCCNGQDCHHIVKEETILIRPSGGYVVKATGEVVDEGHVADSPNGEWHMCRMGDTVNGVWTANAGQVRCLLIPPGGM